MYKFQDFYLITFGCTLGVYKGIGYGRMLLWPLLPGGSGDLLAQSNSLIGSCQFHWELQCITHVIFIHIKI